MDTHVSYLASESRYSGAGSLPQSTTSAWYGCTQICSGVTPVAQGTFNGYCCIYVYLQFKIEFILHFIVKLKAHYNHKHHTLVIMYLPKCKMTDLRQPPLNKTCLPRENLFIQI
jgi:hypothetical protein